MDLLLKNLRWRQGAEMVSGDIRIRAGVISETGNDLPLKRKEISENFQGAFAYPGLINSHDHLEMNLYPRLGNPPYQNYVEWAKDIYHPTRSPLREIETVKMEFRLLWGGLKNLIAGATTVVNHNPWYRLLGKGKFPVNVVRTAWAHSLALEKNLYKKIPYDREPFVIHAGEGTDTLAFSEITTLHKLKILKPNTVLIHAVALTNEQIQLVIDNQSAVVWCPASNLYMLNRTAPIEKIKHKIKLSLGSDSTLTGSQTLLHEMKAASKTGLASTPEIYDMVTRQPADTFRLPRPLIAPGNPAELFVATAKTEDYFQNLLDLEPSDLSLVVVRGIPRLSNAAHNKWGCLKNAFSVQGRGNFSDINVSKLRKEIRKKVPAEVLDQNPLWNLLDE